MTNEHKANLSKSHAGKRCSPGSEFKKGSVPWNKGMVGVMPTPWNKGKKDILSKESREQMSKSHTGVKLPPFSEERRRNMGNAKKGEKHWKWKDGITPENKKIRRSIDFRLWREAVFARDNWTCQRCRIKGDRLHPHHEKNFAQFPEFRFAIDNGITFCNQCHIEFHKIFGIKDNDGDQIRRFIECSDK